MPEQVQLRLAQGQPGQYGGPSSTPPSASFEIVVQNLDYVKDVAIWGLTYGRYSMWTDSPAQYVETTPDGREIWRANRSSLAPEFVARYTVNGVTYWDNNDGRDYHVPTQCLTSADVLGRDVAVVRLDDSVPATGQVQIRVCVKNLAYEKEVGIVYTTDNWASAPGIALGSYAGGEGVLCDPCTEIWEIKLAVPPGSKLEYAVFFRAQGREHWDNNFWRNYSLQAPQRVALAAGGGA